MIANPEVLLIGVLSDALDVPVSAVVPSRRPEKFVTVERVGGGLDRISDSPQLAVQAWAGSRQEASELAYRVSEILADQAVKLPEVARLDVGGIYNFPDPDSSQDRYQFTVTMRIVR